MPSESKSKRYMIVMLVVALMVILLGNVLACVTQTDLGKVEIRDVRFEGANNLTISALLYVPKGVTAQNPAPGILCIHGYMNSRETQDGFAIEFARRGYVVLAMDQTGHGFSDPPAFANYFGGPDGLRYLRSLDIVDKDNIGLEGHSMGGWSLVFAAKEFPDGYKAVVLEGSGVGTITSTFPRNLAVVLSQWDEFSAAMWGTPAAKDAAKGARLKKVFGTESDVVPGKLYGSIADGTARIFYQPRTTHPGDHISAAAIGDAIDWFQQTLQGGKPLTPSNQTWYWKEIGNLIALIGMILLLFPVGALLLRWSFFKGLVQAPAKPKSAKGISWWISAIIFVVVPPLTYFTFKEYATKYKIAPNVVFPETITAQLLVWLLLVALIAVVLFLIWHFAFNRKAKATASDYGLTWGNKLDWAKIGKSFLLALLVAFAGYLTLVFSAWLFTVDFRFWVFAVKPMSTIHLRSFVSYLIPFMLFFIAIGTVLHGQLRPTSKGNELGQGSEMAINVALLVLGFVGLLLYQYIPLLMGGTLTLRNEILFSILAIQILPIMTIVALAYTYFYRKTGHIYVGAFLCAILVTWILVASQVTNIVM